MRKILFTLTILMLILAADARAPKAGDHVVVKLNDASYDGVIKDISNGFICMHVTNFTENYRTFEIDEDACFGIGGIRLEFLK